MGLLAAPDEELVALLGDPPATAARRSVWCHRALAVERVRDREPLSRDRTGSLKELCLDARSDIAIAEAANPEISATTSDPAAWEVCAGRAHKVVSDLKHGVDLRTRHVADQSLGLGL